MTNRADRMIDDTQDAIETTFEVGEKPTAEEVAETASLLEDLQKNPVDNEV